MRVFNRWEEVERLFHAALGQDPAHRTEFLSRMCADPELLAEVSSLLEAHEKGGSLLDRPPDKAAAEFLQELEGRYDSLVGTSFDHYQITGVLGEGAMGKVYLGQDSRLMRKVALKVLPAPHVQSMERLRRFAQEARVASALNHPNIITVYDYGEAFSSYYIATEYVEGQTLRALIREGIDFGRALDVAIQMASAFAAAHQAGIIHRDIKPENIMVRADGLVKVLDFGLAKLSTQSESMTTLGDAPASVPGAVIGTFCYMSPEQARGQELDARTDIFSFGIVMYEMLAGRRPFEGDSLPDLLNSLVGSDPPPLSTYIPGAPLELEAILAGALARDRDQRYQSFEALLADLTAVKRRLEAGESPKIPFHPSIGPSMTRLSDDGQRATAQAETRERAQADITKSKARGLGAAVIRFRGYLIVAAAAVIAAVGYQEIRKINPPVRNGPAVDVESVKKVTYDGEASVSAVSVSPDGKNFAYVRRNALSILSMPASDQDNPRELSSVACLNCAGATFSLDGRYVYYVAGEPEKGALYREQITGGQSEKIAEDVDRSISFSPKGDRFIFVRNSRQALLTANVDGTDERILTVADHDGDVWLYPAWSPDGRRVVCGMRNRDKADEEVYMVSLADGSKQIVRSATRWVRIRNLAWVSDTEFIVNATGDQTQASALWLISYPGGEAHKLTTDLSEYFGASLSADSRTLVSVRVDYSMNLYIGGTKDSGAAKKINLGPLKKYGATGLCWTPDRKVIYSAGPVGKTQLYVYDPSGANGGEPLTSGPGDNTWPSVTPDNTYIVFASDRDGSLSIWRIDRDGSNPKRLTSGGLRPTCLRDGKTVVYQVTEKDGHTSLWEVPIDGGDTPTRVTEAGVDAENAAVSPDGHRIAYSLSRPGDPNPQIAVIGPDQHLPDTYGLPGKVRLPIIRWRNAGALLYIDQWGEGSDIWEQRLDHRSGPRRLRSSSHAEFNSVLNFDWRGDGDGQLVLSAGTGFKSDVIELALRPHR